jgi:hypothetical protein
MDEKLTSWLLDSDPAIKWQVLKLLDDQELALEERKKIEKIGWGRRLLDQQDSTGTWSQGFYGPKFTSTTYTLLLLKRLGIDNLQSQCQKGAKILLEQGLLFDGGINFSTNVKVSSETCITGMIFSLLTYFRIEEPNVKKIFSYIEKNQMQDGGWNCKYPIKKATHASFNTTMLVLEGLQMYRELLQSQKKDFSTIASMEERGREFLLNHRLFKSHTTGEIVKEDYLKFPFPYHWKYDVLTALDYFQSSKAPYDERLEDAIELVKSKSENGYLKNFRGQSGKIWFTLETVGKNSKYNTLRWQRVLKWWNEVN